MRLSLRSICLASFLGAFVAGFASVALGASFEFEDGDRVVFVGDTLAEREQLYGYIEQRLTVEFPDRNVTFRNLGWSGDTIRGEARASGYQNPEGMPRLLKISTISLSLKGAPPSSFFTKSRIASFTLVLLIDSPVAV